MYSFALSSLIKFTLGKHFFNKFIVSYLAQTEWTQDLDTIQHIYVQILWRNKKQKHVHMLILVFGVWFFLFFLPGLNISSFILFYHIQLQSVCFLFLHKTYFCKPWKIFSYITDGNFEIAIHSYCLNGMMG